MNVVVLTRNPRGIASRFLARGTVDVAAVLLDEGAATSWRRRLRKLRRVGVSAAPVGLVLRNTYAASGGDVPPLDELEVPVTRVPTLNGPEARAALEGADVALSLDNALIAEETFSLPRLGTINVHHGAVPEYRGGPPLFWELADGLERVGFTIHRVDTGIDTGPVLAEGEVPIERRGTLRETLAATVPALHEASLDALEAVLLALGRGDLEERPQPPGGRHRTTPTLRDYLRVRRALLSASAPHP